MMLSRSLVIAALGFQILFPVFPPPTAIGDTLARANPPTAFECRWARGPITIDGKADESEWKQAELIDYFYLPWLRDKVRPARTATRARLLWDRDNLYFFADMDDSDLYADVKQHDGMTWFNDVFELFFKPAEDKPAYYEFQVNAAGTVMDMLLPRRGAGGFQRFIGDGDFHIEAKVKLRGTLNKWQDKDEGWSVEGRIPWTDFLRTGGRPEPDTNWKFALCRYDYSVDFEGPETSTCAPLKGQGQANFHYHEDYATLKFVGPNRKDASSKPSRIDQIVALTTSRVVGSPDPPLPFRVVRSFPKLKVPFPIYVRREPGTNRLWIIQQKTAWGGVGGILRIPDDPAVEQAEELLQLDGIAYGLTFHPDFANNGYVYVGDNGPMKTKPKQTRVTRYTVERQPPFRPDPKSAKVIIAWDSDGHNGGDLDFGTDGMLYVTSGDGTSDSDTNLAGQDLTHLLAKVLRIDVDHPEPGKEYAVPKDNPFVGQANIRPETWAYGFRNPWRLTYDHKLNQLWVSQNGQDLWEQGYLVEKGANYGWSVTEGSHPFYPNRKAGPHPIRKPTVEHHHSEARSLTGGVVYHGEKFPDLRGAYVYGDWSTGKIWAVKHDGKQVVSHRPLVNSTLQITGFGLDTKGELLIVDHVTGFYRLEAVPPETPREPFPTKLSETGLFRSVKGHDVEPALIPFSVNSPLWSDGAHKERYLAIPAKVSKDFHIDLNAANGWNFPDETVVVKSFALDGEDRTVTSRRWIETRLLTRQEGQWVGYSYAWNDEQTEATLVPAGGMDRTFTVRGEKQPWHYPSRTECMVCHSRAANWVLGLSTPQMNKVHDYDGVVMHQFDVLAYHGLLRVNWTADATAQLREEAKAKGMKGKELEEFMSRQTATRWKEERSPSRLLARSPDKYPQLADPYDGTQPLEERARSYLHANCAQCHVNAGGGNAAMELGFKTARDKMKLIDEKPLHHTFDIPDARLIAPGAPDRSVLLHRLTRRGPGQMPPLATAAVDTQAVRLFREWIEKLPVK